MTAALIDPPSGANTNQAYEVVSGTGTANDSRRVQEVVLVDPSTGVGLVPGSVTFTSLSIADGSDVAQGATTDAASANSVVGLLKNIKASLAALHGSFPKATNAGVNPVTGVGVLHAITVNKKGATANTASVYDGVDAGGTLLGIIDTTVQAGTLLYDYAFTVGLYVVMATGTAADLTIVSTS